MSKESLAWLRASPEAKSIRSSTQWAVLKEVVWKYDEKRDFAWPGVSWLAEETRLARSTVQVALGELERLGWLYRVPRSGTSNCYLVPLYRDNVADFEGARESGTPDDPERAAGAREPGRGARESGGGAREPGGGMPESRAQQVVETQETYAKQGKPRGINAKSTSQGAATDAQLVYLRDIYILANGALPVVEQLARDRELTKTEADDEIRRGWAQVEQYGPAFVPAAFRMHLSDNAAAWLDKRKAVA